MGSHHEMSKPPPASEMMNGDSKDHTNELEEQTKPGIIQNDHDDHKQEKAGLDTSILNTDSEPLAIIGLSFRFPQGMETTRALWNGLISKRSAWSEFPSTRLNFQGIYDPDEERLNSVSN